MSNDTILQCLNAMDRLLVGNHVELDPQQIALWKQTLDAALENADKGPGWDEVVRRAQGLKTRIDGAVAGLRERQADIKRELDAQNTGARALRAYRPG